MPTVQLLGEWYTKSSSHTHTHTLRDLYLARKKTGDCANAKTKGLWIEANDLMCACFTSAYIMETARQRHTCSLLLLVRTRRREGGRHRRGAHGLRYPARPGLFLPGGNVCFTYDKVPLSTDHCWANTSMSWEAQSGGFPLVFRRVF